MGALRDLLRPRRGERLLPALSGVLLALSFPPFDLVAIPFVALVPFAAWIQELPPDREGRWAAARGGTVLGVVYWGAVVYWILVALLRFSWLAVPAYLLSVGVLALVVVFSAWALHRLVHSGGLAPWLALPLAWTAGEWIRGHLPDIAFPWLGLGTSLTEHPELAGAAELVGARGLTFWIALVNGLVVAAVLAWRKGRRPVREAVIAALALALPMVWGVWRAGHIELRSLGSVAVVQPDIEEDLKVEPRAALDSTRRSLDRLMARPELPGPDPDGPELVVWPEAVFPTELERWPSLRSFVRERARAAGAPVLLGSLRREEGRAGAVALYNSAFLVMPDEGLADYRHDKHFLVPVVERVPWIDPRVFGSLRHFGAYGKGRGWPLGRTRSGIRFGTLICYESAFPEASRSLRREGADFLVNITNDAWYGWNTWYARTSALRQHPAHLVMRAIENRVGVVRAANTGISMFVDPLGRTYEETRLFTPDVRTAEVYTTDVLTLYTRLGDLLGTGSAGAVLLLVAWSVVKDRSEKSRADGRA